MARFFLLWIVLAPALAVTTFVTSLLLFRNVDLSAPMFFSLLMIPAAQAAVLAAFLRPPAPSTALRLADPRSGQALRRALSHPLTRPVLLLDAVIVPAGWLLPHHPLLGMAAAAVLQRRWMGTKLIVAAVGLCVEALRRGSPALPAERRVLATTALVLAAIGLNGFVPLLAALAHGAPAPLLHQPPIIVLFELYTGLTVVAIALVLKSARVLRKRAPEAASLYDCASGALFLTSLCITMNGFLSLQPAEPWAGLAVTCGSAAGTLLAIAGILIALRRHDY